MAVEFDDWEKSRLVAQLACDSIQYLSHYDRTGLFRSEVDTMNRIFRLKAKISGEEPPEDLPYIGYVRNGWNRNAD